MKITLHLADAAQPDQLGKVSALGLGWSFIGTPMGPHAIVAFIEVDPSEAGKPHKFQIALINEDGKEAAINGHKAFEADGDFNIASDPGAVAGATQVHAFAFPVPPGLALPVAKRWEYRMTVGAAVGSVGFATRVVP
jgi:hypothetical protein